MVRFTLNRQELSSTLRAKGHAALLRHADDIGNLVRKQTLRRFREKGDDEVRWADLLANDDAAMSKMIASLTRNPVEARLMFKLEVKAAEQSVERVRGRIRSGKVSGMKARQQLRKARNKARLSMERMETGNASYRRGGQPLRDTGAGVSSLTWRVVSTSRGVRVEVVSPLEYMHFHQHGFQTDGPNYIPLSQRARKKPKGDDPAQYDLVEGYDFVMAWGGVKVPARPFVRLSPRDEAELARFFGAEV